MAPHFTKGGKIEDLQGFIKIEVWQIENEADYDQMYVNTWWESEDDFKGWLSSDAFKEAPRQIKNSEESPVLGNEVVKATVLSKLN